MLAENNTAGVLSAAVAHTGDTLSMATPGVVIEPTADLPGFPPRLRMRMTRFSTTVLALIKGIPGAVWHGMDGYWYIPRTSFETAMRAFASIPTYLHESLERPPPAELPQQVDLDGDTAADIAANYTFKTKPFKHQVTGMVLATYARRFALLMEQGTGKTKTAIDSLSYWMAKGYIEGALILSPKSVVYSWEREVGVHSPLAPLDRLAVVLRGSTKLKRDMLEETKLTHAFFITNYASLLAPDLDLIGLVQRRRLAVVLDESLAIKTPTSKTWKQAEKLGKATQYKLILNGTPITQGALDYFTQFSFLDTQILGHHSFFSFKSEYAIMGGFQNKQVVGYRNLERLQRRVAPNMFRVLKRDCLDLPEKLYSTIEVDAGEEQRNVYRQMKKEAIVEIGDLSAAAPVVLTKLLRLAQIAAGYLPLHDEFGKEAMVKELDNPKLEACVELVEQSVGQGRKVIVWCLFIKQLEDTAKALTEHGVVTYYGQTSAEDRQAAVDRFQTDPTCKVFVGQVAAGGVGITLTAATVEIYMSNSFRLVDRLQSEDRAHRIGQKQNVDIYDIVVRGTVDTYVLKTLRDKKNIADVVTGDNMREAMGEL